MLTKKLNKIWYDGDLWKVEKVYSRPYQDYMVLSRTDEDGDHEMVMIDGHNHEFYPDNPKTRSVMAAIRKAKYASKRVVNLHQGYLTDCWLGSLKVE
jgi:hypothetical protein